MTDTSDRPVREGPVGGAFRGLLGIVGGIVRLVTGLFAAILAVHVVLVILAANPDNGITQLIAALADSLTLGLRDLFLLGSPVAQVIVSYGLPAIAWLVIGALVVTILRVFARPRSGLA